MSKQNDEPKFYLDKPKLLTIRMLSLLLPAIASSIGFYCFTILAFSFTELNVLSASFRTSLVLVGSFSLAFGAEIGTISSVVEIFRKSKKLRGWDAIAFAISIASTLAAFVLAFASLLGANAGWSDTVKLYGPIVLGLLAALDSYGGFVEFALHLKLFDEKMQRYNEAQRWHREAEFNQIKDAEFALRQKQNDAMLKIVDKKDLLQEDVKDDVKIAQDDNVKDVKKSTSKDARIAQMLKLYAQNPDANQKDIAQKLDVTRQTVSNYLAQCETEGKIARSSGVVKIVKSDGVK